METDRTIGNKALFVVEGKGDMVMSCLFTAPS